MLLHEEQYMYYVAGSNDNIYVQMTTCIIIKASENSQALIMMIMYQYITSNTCNSFK